MQIDEPDYTVRLAAYEALSSAGGWPGLRRWQASPLLHSALHDLRNPDDLALRHSAAQALARFLDAAAAEEKEKSGSAAEEDAEGLVPLVQRLLFPQIKKALSAPNLAVRQVRLLFKVSLVPHLPHCS